MIDVDTFVRLLGIAIDFDEKSSHTAQWRRNDLSSETLGASYRKV